MDVTLFLRTTYRDAGARWPGDVEEIRTRADIIRPLERQKFFILRVTGFPNNRENPTWRALMDVERVAISEEIDGERDYQHIRGRALGLCDGSVTPSRVRDHLAAALPAIAETLTAFFNNRESQTDQDIPTVTWTDLRTAFWYKPAGRLATLGELRDA